MGYITTFELTWEKQKGYEDTPNCQHRFDSPFCPECGIPRGVIALDDLIAEYIKGHEDGIGYALEPDGETLESCKWYDWLEDMIKMSRDFPNVLFKLHGEGEQNEDVWDAYFLNGKSQVHKAKMIIDECDPNGWE